MQGFIFINSPVAPLGAGIIVNGECSTDLVISASLFRIAVMQDHSVP